MSISDSQSVGLYAIGVPPDRLQSLAPINRNARVT